MKLIYYVQSVIDDSLSKAIKETFQTQPLTVVVRTLS